MSEKQHLGELVDEIRKIEVLLARQNDLLHAILELQKQIKEEVIRAGLA